MQNKSQIKQVIKQKSKLWSLIKNKTKNQQQWLKTPPHFYPKRYRLEEKNVFGAKETWDF